MVIDKNIWRNRLNLNLKRSYGCYKVWNKIERLNIGITNRCTGDCVFCFREEFKSVTKRIIPYEAVILYMDEISKYSTFGHNELKRINFGVNGEPLLHPNIVEFVAHAREISRDVRISTNLMDLSENMSIELLEAGLNKICLSIDECEKERFEALRRNLIFETVLDNALRFKRIRDEGNYKCDIVLSPVLCLENEHRQDIIKRFWESKLDIKIKFSKEIPIGKIIDRVQPWFNHKSIPQCNNMVVIKANGDLNCCCYDVFSNNPLGNIYEIKGFEDVLKSNKLRKFRKSLEQLNNIPEHCKICVSLPQATFKRRVESWSTV